MKLHKHIFSTLTRMRSKGYYNNTYMILVERICDLYYDCLNGPIRLIYSRLRVVPTPPTHGLLWKVISLQLFAAETCNKFLKIEHHDSIVYRKNERILNFLAGATSQSSNLTVGNTTQEPLDLPA